ncbi:MAG: hypothetical protein C4547_06460 [Phycisphaerales bacterium]|nr:MAG: hypothetical protein C4547_06460 [Phycisphaerales bacterium]
MRDGIETAPKDEPNSADDCEPSVPVSSKAANRCLTRPASMPRLPTAAANERRRLGEDVDALHVAAARRSRCKEFVTAEKPDKLPFRVGRPTVRTIR